MEDQSSEPRHKVTVRPLSRFNWEEATQLEVHDYQRNFMPSVLHTIAQSKYENIQPFGIFLEGEMVGFISYGEFSGVCWVNRILVARDFQQKGIGREALGIVLDKLRKHPQCKEIRTSFSKQNAMAEYLFSYMGFRKLSDANDGEIVMVFRG